VRKLIFGAGLLLAACGVDGAPVQPEGGVAVSVSPSGVGLGATLGLRQGPVQVGVGL